MKLSIQIGLILLCLVMPLAINGNAFLDFVAALFLLNVMTAENFNLLSSFLGLDNLALGGLVGFGAYTTAYLEMHMGFSFWAAFPVAGIVALVIGTVLGLPSLRLKGLYFIILTLMMMLVITELFTDWFAFTNGEIGVSSIPPPVLALGSLHIVFVNVPFLYLSISVLIPWMYVVGYLVRGKSGLRMVAVRDDEILASHLGVDTTRQKITSFAICAFTAGLFGSLFAELLGYVAPTSVDILFTVSFFAMVYIGGRKTVAGPVIGAALLTALPNLFVTFSAYRNYVTGILLVVIMLFFPDGLIGIYQRVRARWMKSVKPISSVAS